MIFGSHSKENAAGWLAALCISGLLACASTAPDEPTTAPVQPEPAKEAPAHAPAEPKEPPTTEPETAQQPEPATPQVSQDHSVPYSDTVWAAGKQGVLMKGLDGGLYEPYLATVVQQVQGELRSQGLYDGPVSGVLDETTMQALGEFQDQNGLQVSGVPTPLTRERLIAGSAQAPQTAT